MPGLCSIRFRKRRKSGNKHRKRDQRLRRDPTVNGIAMAKRKPVRRVSLHPPDGQKFPFTIAAIVSPIYKEVLYLPQTGGIGPLSTKILWTPNVHGVPATLSYLGLKSSSPQVILDRRKTEMVK
jgi:hypothetical protein